MPNDGPDGGYWATPGQPAPEPPAGAPPGSGGWSTGPPPPPPYGGWSTGPPPPPTPNPGWSTGPPPPPPYGWGPNAIPVAPQPGVIPLRPLGVGELLDGAFTTIRRYPAATIGIATPIMFVVEVVQVLLTYSLFHGVVDTTFTTNADGTLSTGTGDLFARTSTLDLAVLVVTLLATALLSGMLAAVVGEGALGRPMSASQAWQAARGRFWRLLGAALVVFLIPFLCVVVGVLPGIIVIALFGAHGAEVAILVIGALVSLPVIVYVSTLLAFTTPALMLEKQGIFASLSRSRTLVRGSWWRVFGIILLAGIIASVIAGIIGVPFAAAGGSLSGIFSGHPENQLGFGQLLLSGIGGLLGAILVRPFMAALLALLYLDRRMRAEALDLTLQQAAANPRS
jgi:hypothetical protein